MGLAAYLGGVVAALCAAVACSSSDDTTTPTTDGTPDGAAQGDGGTTPGTDGSTTPGTDGSTPGTDGGAAVTLAELRGGRDFTCARFSNGTVKCWGTAAEGQLGRGNKDTLRGNLTIQPPIDLGPGQRATALSVGGRHACVVLDAGGVKCWGSNTYGQLGLGDTSARGDDVNEMGASLPLVDLGVGAKATQVAAGEDHTCALLDDGRVKCWGENARGQLGTGEEKSRGDGPNEMGASLPAVDLGTGKKAVELSAGFYATCARLDDGSVKCWGWNSSGELGQGDTNDRGNSAGQMGDALPAVNLGAGRTAAQIWIGVGSACARLDDGSLKCWGAVLGMYGNVFASVGDEPGEMAALVPVDLGTGRKVIELAKGLAAHACVRLDDGKLKCWGANKEGQLGLGDTTTREDSVKLGDALPAVDLGAGRTAASITVGSGHTCARLDDGRAKCWGSNAGGQLGLGDENNRGDGPGEMGDALPALGF